MLNNSSCWNEIEAVWASCFCWQSVGYHLFPLEEITSSLEDNLKVKPALPDDWGADDDWMKAWFVNASTGKLGRTCFWEMDRYLPQSEHPSESVLSAPQEIDNRFRNAGWLTQSGVYSTLEHFCYRWKWTWSLSIFRQFLFLLNASQGPSTEDFFA